MATILNMGFEIVTALPAQPKAGAVYLVREPGEKTGTMYRIPLDGGEPVSFSGSVLGKDKTLFIGVTEPTEKGYKFWFNNTTGKTALMVNIGDFSAGENMTDVWLQVNPNYVTEESMDERIEQAIEDLGLGNMAFSNHYISTADPDNSIGKDGDIWSKIKP